MNFTIHLIVNESFFGRNFVYDFLIGRSFFCGVNWKSFMFVISSLILLFIVESTQPTVTHVCVVLVNSEVVGLNLSAFSSFFWIFYKKCRPINNSILLQKIEYQNFIEVIIFQRKQSKSPLQKMSKDTFINILINITK